MRRTRSLILAVMVCLAVCVRARGADDEMAKKRAAEIGLQPGMMLDQSTAGLAKGLVPPEILKHYENGEFANKIADNYPANGGTHGPDFDAETKRNAEKLTVDANGTIVDKTTAKQPAYIYGTPFPKVDAKDPQAGVKVLWNFFYNYYWNGNSHNAIDLVWVNPNGVDRKAGQDVYFKYYDGLPPDLKPENPQNLLSQFIAVSTHPQDLYGTAALDWRYRDPAQRDAVWAYVPALRRIRGLSPANRSDGFLGSDMSQDDGPFFDGKPEDFTWKLVGEEEILRQVDPFALAKDCNFFQLPGGGWRSVFKDVPTFGFQDPNWKGIAWAPKVMHLARRKVWIVEGVPKDRYYLYGKVELRIDSQNWQGSYNRKFSWQGELLNTSSMANAPGHALPDGKHYLSAGGCVAATAQVAENVKLNRATVVTVESGKNNPGDRHIPLDPSFFDYQTLYRFGQ